MKQLKLKQGSPEWLAHRRNFRNASDAPAMMGCSPYKTRDQLLYETYTGLTSDVGEAQQRRFDTGHESERLARPLAEEIIGQRLYPVVGTEGNLSASFDGLTMACDINYEHKTLNDALRAAMIEGATGADLPLLYRVQMEQQHVVSGAKKTLFMTSKWAAEDLVEERHVWYTPDPALAEQIIAGWAQFEIDLANYVPPAVATPVVAKAAMHLPAISIKVQGDLALIDNLDVFGAELELFIEAINLKPETDQDFADLDADTKTLKRSEDALKTGKAGALAQIESVDVMVRKADHYAELCRKTRLMGEKIYTNEKESRKAFIVLGGRDALASHVKALNERLGHPYMPLVQADFAGVSKGLKTVASMQGAVNDELARAKIEANAIADRIQVNLATINEKAKDHLSLFADLPQLVLKAKDDLQAVIDQRITKQREADDARLEQQREQIRKQEEKAAQDRADELNAKRQQAIRRIESQAEVVGPAGALRQVLIEVQDWQVTEEEFGSLFATAQAAKDRTIAKLTSRIEAAEAAAAAAAAPQAAPVDALPPIVADLLPAGAAQEATTASTVRQFAAPAPKTVAASTPPTLKLGEIAARLGFSLPADFLRTLGFEPADKQRGACLYHESDFTRMLGALHDHIDQVQAKQAA